MGLPSKSLRYKGKAIRYGELQLTRAEIDGLRSFLAFARLPVAGGLGGFVEGKSLSRGAAKGLSAKGLIAVGLPAEQTRNRNFWAVLTPCGVTALESYREWRGEC